MRFSGNKEVTDVSRRTVGYEDNGALNFKYFLTISIFNAPAAEVTYF